MKKVLAIFVLVVLAVSFGLTSCSTQKPCPAYSQANSVEVKS